MTNPPDNILSKKGKKKGYAYRKASEAAEVKVFRQNTTQSAAECGDFGENPQGLTFTAD